MNSLEHPNLAPKLLRGIAALIAALVVTNLFLPQDSPEQSITLTFIIGFVVFAGMQFISSRDMQTPEPIGRVRSHAAFLIATIVMVMVYGQLSGRSQLIPIALIVGWFGYTIWRRPAMAAFSAMSAAAFAGGPMILIAAPAAVMLARRDMRLRIGERRSIMRTLKTIGLALLAFLIALLFADAAVGGGQSGSQGSRGAESAGGGTRSPLERLADWISGADGSETPSRVIRVPRDAATPPDDPTRWWLLALIVGTLVLAGLAFWFWRRRKRGDGLGGPTVAEPLARLEMLGAAVGRPRRQHEGALSYASELSNFTGDDRLAGTGSLVSGQVYASATAHAPAVEADLLALEQTPPQAPPQPSRRERIVQSIRDAVTIRGVALGGVAIGGAIAVMLVASFNSQALREPHLMNELSARIPANTPDEWNQVMTLDDDDVHEWQVCRGWGDDSGVGTESVSAVSGVTHKDQALGAMLVVAQNGNERTPQYASWSVGSNDSSSSWWDPNPTRPAHTNLQHDWQTLDGYNNVPNRVFQTVEETLLDLGVRESVRSEHVDSFGWPFTRFESRPLRYDDNVVSGEVLPEGIDGSYDTMWVVDIWTDEDDRPERIRVMGDLPQRSWSEWHRLPEAQPVRLASPLCPTLVDANTGEWVGWETWTPSRSVEPQIAVDGEGNPYDIFYWDDQFDQVTSEPAGDLAGPVAELGIGDIFTLVQDEPIAPIKVATNWTSSASIDALSLPDGWPTGALITAEGADQITHWVTEADVDIYSTFVTLTTADTYPSLTNDELDGWLEPMWDGDLLTTIHFADQRTSPVTVLTLSDATKVVTGRDAQGQVAAVLIWDEGSAWRQLGLGGTPPDSVLEREEQLRECLAGTRETDTTGRCVWAD